MNRMILLNGALAMLFTFAGFACSRYDANPAEVPDPTVDEPLADSPDQPGAGAMPDAAAVQPNEGEPQPVSIENQTDRGAATQADASAEPATKQIVLAGGCFWCVEAVYEQLDGVLDVESGYAGGDAATANYDAVKTGQTKHAEVVRITYDPSKITLGKIYKVFFATAHDPTTLNRQGADVGPQYRSAIFYANESQKQIAANYIKELNEAGVSRDPIVTTLEPLDAYYPAEGFHQDFASQNPTHGYIRAVSTPKVEKTRKFFPELLNNDSED